MSNTEIDELTSAFSTAQANALRAYVDRREAALLKQIAEKIEMGELKQMFTRAALR